MRRPLQCKGKADSQLRAPGPSGVVSTSRTARRHPMLDLFYLLIGVAGFLALWGITKACERV
jgi:hypothetical protein